MIAANVVAQQRGRFIQVNDQDVYVAVVIKISEGATAAAVRGGYSGTSFIDQFFERGASLVSTAATSIVSLQGRALSTRISCQYR